MAKLAGVPLSILTTPQGRCSRKGGAETQEQAHLTKGPILARKWEGRESQLGGLEGDPHRRGSQQRVPGGLGEELLQHRCGGHIEAS